MLRDDWNTDQVEFTVGFFGMETSTLKNLLKPIFDGMVNRTGRSVDMNDGIRYSTFNSEFTDQCRCERNKGTATKQTDVANSVPFTTWPF